MVIRFKDGNTRQVPFNAKLAAKLINLGHSIDYDRGTSEEQREREQASIQKEYDALCLAERCRGYTAP